MQLLEFGKRIALGVAFMIGLSTSAYGLYSIAQDVSSKGIPAWAYLLIGWLFTVGVLVYIVYSLLRENRQLKEDPTRKWKALSQEAKQVIAQMNEKVEGIIESSTLPPEAEGNMEGFLVGLFDFLGLDFEKTEDAIASGDKAEHKKVIDHVIASTQTEIGQKTKT